MAPFLRALPDRCCRAACNAFLSRLFLLGVGDAANAELEPGLDEDSRATAVQGSCSCSCFREQSRSSEEQTDRRLGGVVQMEESEHERDDTGDEAVGVVGELVVVAESMSSWCKQKSGNCSALPWLLGCRCSGDNDPAASGILVEGLLASLR